MPLPLIFGLGIAIGSAVAGGIGTATGVSRINAARRRYEERRARYEIAERRAKERQERANQQLEKFGRRRLEAMVTLGRAAEFLRKAKVKNREVFERLDVPSETLNQWEGASINALEVLGGVGTSLVSGAMTAVGVYGLVGTLASASTGTAISALSGIAAQNATLAWLGGGTLAAGGGGVAMGAVVLGGFLVGPALLVSSFFVHAKASEVERVVEQNVAEMDRAEASMQSHAAYLVGVLKRVKELRGSIQKLRASVENLLASARVESEHDVFQVAKVATSLGSVLDAAVLDDKGNPVSNNREH